MPSENVSSDWWALLLWSWTMHKTVLKALTRSTPRPWRHHRPYFLADVVWCKDSRILLVGSKWLCQTIFKARLSMSFFLDCIHFLLEWKRVLVRTDRAHTQNRNTDTFTFYPLFILSFQDNARCPIRLGKKCLYVYTKSLVLDGKCPHLSASDPKTLSQMLPYVIKKRDSLAIWYLMGRSKIWMRISLAGWSGPSTDSPGYPNPDCHQMETLMGLMTANG